VFGQTKDARGLDRFQLRGLEKANGEWVLMATTHNILKLFRASLASARQLGLSPQSCDQAFLNHGDVNTTLWPRRNA